MRLNWRERRPEDVRRWLAGLAAVLLIGALVAACHLSGVRVCLFHRLTGLPCLTCGATRAFIALASGDVGAALRLQPLAVVGCVAVALAGAAYAGALFFFRRTLVLTTRARERLSLGAALALLLALNWAYLVWSGV